LENAFFRPHPQPLSLKKGEGSIGHSVQIAIGIDSESERKLHNNYF